MSKANCRRYGTFEGKSISSVKFVYSKNPKDHKTGNRARLRTLSSDKYSSEYVSFRYGRGTIVKVLSKSLKNKKGYANLYNTQHELELGYMEVEYE